VAAGGGLSTAGQAGAGGQLAGGAGGASPGGAGNAGLGGVSGAGGNAGVAGDGQGGSDPCALSAAPAGDELDTTLPDLPVGLLGDDGQETLTTLHSLRAACDQPSLLLIRVEPAWCAPCGLRADQTRDALGPLLDQGVGVLTVLYAGPDNALPTAADARAWQKAHPTLPGLVGRSPDGALGQLIQRRASLPQVYLVDRRTMRISNVIEAPRPGDLRSLVPYSLHEAGGPMPALSDPDEPLIDERFDAFDWQLVQQMASRPPAPPSPSNAHADDPAAAALGDALFHDADLAGEHKISCATCHQPDKGYGDGFAVAAGVSSGSINTPGIATAARQRWLFWDGRADSLWSQALGPLENPIETAGTRLHVAHRVRAAHAADFEAVFGPLPPLDDTKRFPPEGKPGDATYDGMSAADQASITTIFVQVGKAIEAYERTLSPAPIRLETYAAGQYDSLTTEERDGLYAFLHGGCVNCHSGPALSDGAFHDVLMPSHSATGPGDRGRIDGVTKLLASPFRADGPHSDDPTAGALLSSLVSESGQLGQLRTPSLRNVALTGPWGHGGTFSTLTDVVKHYGQAAPLQAGPRTAGQRDPAIPAFLSGHDAVLVAFLQSLGG
jgi:cytochrome c peroxidase